MATPTVPGRVLLVDDDPDIRESLAAALDPTRYVLISAADGAAAVSLAEGFSPEVVLLDLGLPDVQGLDLIPRIRELDELVGVIVLTATSEISVVVRAMRLGADNFLVKPVSLETLNDVLGRTLLARRRDRQLRALVARSEGSEASVLVGGSRPMRRVVDLINQVADTDATVLLEGESGTGKGMAAEMIHRASARSDGPFLDMNCAGLTPTLLESELFGHEKGAFTDASQPKPGLLEIASGGSVFLDEIGEANSSRSLRAAASGAWAGSGTSAPTCASSRLPTAISRRRSRMEHFARICFTGSTCSPSIFHPCATERTTSSNWPTSSSVS